MGFACQLKVMCSCHITKMSPHLEQFFFLEQPRRKVIDAATVWPSQVPTNGVGQITIEALEVYFTVKVFDSPIVMPCQWCQTTIEALQGQFIVKAIFELRSPVQWVLLVTSEKCVFATSQKCLPILNSSFWSYHAGRSSTPRL